MGSRKIFNPEWVRFVKQILERLEGSGELSKMPFGWFNSSAKDESKDAKKSKSLHTKY